MRGTGNKILLMTGIVFMPFFIDGDPRLPATHAAARSEPSVGT